MQRFIKRNLRNFLVLMLVLTMMFSTQLTAFAAPTSKTVISKKEMSIALSPGTTGNSNQLHSILVHYLQMQL